MVELLLVVDVVPDNRLTCERAQEERAEEEASAFSYRKLRTPQWWVRPMMVKKMSVLTIPVR